MCIYREEEKSKWGNGNFFEKKQLFFEDKTFVKNFEGAGKECLRERRKRHFGAVAQVGKSA